MTLRTFVARTEGLPRFGQVQPEHKAIWNHLPTIDWFWVRIGVKGGLASVIALLLLRWINPPGPASIPLGAWVFTILSRPFVRAGGPGDLRIFQRMFLAALCFIPIGGAATYHHPCSGLLSCHESGSIRDPVHVWFFDRPKPGLTFGTQVVVLGISVFVGLNPQQPVASITIIESFLGLTLGMIDCRGRREIDLAGVAAAAFQRRFVKVFCATQGSLEQRTASGKNSHATGNSAGRSSAGSAPNSN